MGAARLVAIIPEHKIGIFVRFCHSKPSFSALSSTKSRFLCAFALRNPHFRAFRAQKGLFCVRNGNFSQVLAHSEHKIGVFVRFLPSKPPFSGFSSTKSAFLCQKRRYFPGFGPFRAQNRGFCAQEEGKVGSESVTAETLTVNVAFLQITEHAYKMQTPHNQIINF